MKMIMMRMNSDMQLWIVVWQHLTLTSAALDIYKGSSSSSPWSTAALRPLFLRELLRSYSYTWMNKMDWSKDAVWFVYLCDGSIITIIAHIYSNITIYLSIYLSIYLFPTIYPSLSICLPFVVRMVDNLLSSSLVLSACAARIMRGLIASHWGSCCHP